MRDKIQHFGMSLKQSSKNKICREHYAIYTEKHCETFGQSECKEHQEACLINYDKNMAFFEQISKSEFEKELSDFVDSNKKIKQIFDLNECKKMCGLYILVLDEYKQVYIGQSTDIKRRILNHWSKQKEFFRLLWGTVNNSVLSIDSFGALDTTRIFVLETRTLNSSEQDLVKKIPAHLKLNRIGGGTINSDLDFLMALEEWNLRPLKDFHNEENTESYEKEVDITYFESKALCSIEDLSEGDVFCLERMSQEKNSPEKYYGEFVKKNQTTLWAYTYCRSTLGNSCYSSKYKNKTLLPTEIKLKNNMVFSKVDMVEKKEKHTFWRSKKYPHIEA